MTISQYRREFKRLEKIYPNGSWGAWDNAADTMKEAYGLHYEDLNEEQELHFWQLATDIDTIRESEIGCG